MISATRYKWLVFIIGLLVATNAMLLYLYTQPANPPKPAHEKEATPKKGKTAQLLEKEVGFTPEQLAQYDSLRDAHWKSMGPYFEKLRDAKQSFYELLRVQDVPDSTLLAAARKIGESQEVIDIKTFGHFEEVKKLCRPEQKEKFEAFVTEVLRKMTMTRKNNSPNKPGQDSTKNSSAEK